MKYNSYNAELFREYFNNFLTVERFAEYLGKSLDHTRELLKHGRYSHELEATQYKSKGK